MNGVKNETHVRFEQTARGIWYCSGLDVYGENTSHLRSELEVNIMMIEGVLLQHNKPERTDVQHEDLTTSQHPVGKKGRTLR